LHPDAIIAALRRELDRLDPAGSDYAGRRKLIEAEIERVDALERPEVLPERPQEIADPNVSYLEGLKRELERVGQDAKAEIRKEIARVEALIAGGQPQPEPDVPATAGRESARARRRG
jgi:hypothetical protein